MLVLKQINMLPLQSETLTRDLLNFAIAPLQVRFLCVTVSDGIMVLELKTKPFSDMIVKKL